MEGVFLLCFTLIRIIMETDACPTNHDECFLIEALFENYSALARPRANSSDTLFINVSFVMQSLSTIDENEEFFEVVGFWSLDWYDEFLTWTPADYGDIYHIVLQAERIWLPDLFIEDSLDGFYDYSYRRDFKVNVHYSGGIHWDFGGTIRTRCSVDITNYPYDTQTCSLTLGSWMYDHFEVDMFPVPYLSDVFEDVISNSLWELKRIFTEKFYRFNGRFAYLKYSYTYQRKALYYEVNIFLPIIFLFVVAMGAFWIPADSGEKTSICITVLLAFSVYQLIITERTPVTSDVTPNIIKLVLLMLTLSTVSLLSAMLTVYYYLKNPVARVPKIMRIIAFKGLAKILFLRKDVPDEPEDFSDSDTNRVSPFIGHENISNPAAKQPPQGSFNQMLLQAMYEELKFLKDVVQGKENEAFVVSEWKCLGKIIDRFMFLLCMVVFVIGIIAIYAPN